MRTINYVATSEDDGRRVSRIVRAKLQLSNHLFAQLKVRGAVLVDGEPVRANHIVRAGQEVSVRIDDCAGGRDVPPENAPVDIAYMDDDILIIDKSAPLPCQSSARQRTGTLENRLAHLFRDRPGFRLRPVNRLDKGTSGLMAAAMHPHAQAVLARQLHTDALVREYLAVVCGAPHPAAGTIDAPIAKADGATVRREARPDGKSAVTRYELVRTGASGLSLVKLRLETGRTHQIRVHMSHIGCPVFGDFLYGEEDARLPGRFALHSHRIELDHPVTGDRLALESLLPDELGVLLD